MSITTWYPAVDLQGYGYMEEASESEDDNCVKYSDYKALQSRLAELETALGEAIKWIRKAPEDAWGIGTSGGGSTHWYIRDEVLSNLEKKLETK